MDEIARFNKARWEELSKAGVGYSRPWLDLDAKSARKRVDHEGLLPEIDGRDVLLLAGGGGQQSAAFALLGAKVTVQDLCEHQLDLDRKTANHYELDIETRLADMRDLAPFRNESFDLVWHAHSLNFVPEAKDVFEEVVRVLRPGGRYRLHCTNPFTHATLNDRWSEGLYSEEPYVDGAELAGNPYWDVRDESGRTRKIEGPREFLHALSTLLNAPLSLGLRLLGAWEDFDSGDPKAKRGSWERYCSIAPPWLTFWWEKPR